MKLKSKATLVILAVIMVFTTVGCEKEGGAEKTGKKIDKAFSTAKEKIKDATK